MRLCTDWCRRVDWEDDARELGVSLLVVRVFPVLRRKAVGQRGAYTEWYEVHNRASTYAHFSAHALARWYQRSFQPTEDSLINALWLAYDLYQDIVPSMDDDAPFRLEVPGLGEWRGHVSAMRDLGSGDADTHYSRTLNIRTFC